MSFTSLNLLIVLLLLVAFWRDSLRVRERAIRICRTACESHGLQLLDQTVALQRLRLAWTTGGPRLRRTYAFDYSLEGIERRTGALTMLGSRNLSLHLDLPRGDSGHELTQRPSD